MEAIFSGDQIPRILPHDRPRSAWVEEQRYLGQARANFYRDMNSRMHDAVEKVREKAREEGRKEGREEAREEGRQALFETAVRLLREGIPADTVITCTGLPREEIEGLGD